MKTYYPSTHEIPRKWLVIDAQNIPLGRLAARVAILLRGKHKAIYTPHMDTGDYVVVINADNVLVTGRKTKDKIYYRYTGYPGGLRAENFADMMAAHPGRAIELAVKGMLPRNPLGRAMYRKLKIYAGTEHPHTAQQPQRYTIKGN